MSVVGVENSGLDLNYAWSLRIIPPALKAELADSNMGIFPAHGLLGSPDDLYFLADKKNLSTNDWLISEYIRKRAIGARFCQYLGCGTIMGGGGIRYGRITFAQSRPDTGASSPG